MPVTDVSTGEVYRIFKEEIIPVLYNLFQRIEASGILPNSFYDTSITLIPKPDENIARKENYRPIFLMNLYAKSSKNLANQIQQYIKSIICAMTKWDLIQVRKSG